MPAKTFQDLIVWQKAHDFVLSVYKLTQRFPREEIEECRYYLTLTNDLEYGNTGEQLSLLEEVSKTLEAYSRSILNSDSRMLNTGDQI